jgi:thiol-disulfide isomerase/thioredoxin
MKLTLTACILVLSFVSAYAADSPLIGKSLPKMEKLLPGAKIPSTSGKVVLVDFWASWCAPCKASFPSFNRLQAKYASKGLVIVGIGVDDDPAKYQEFSTKMGAKFPLVHDAEHKAAAFFNPPSMPTTYLTDRKGVIRHVHHGFHGAKTEAEYLREIEALLAEGK